MKLELHCHSCYSKGRKISAEGIPRPEEIVRRAKQIGLSGIAITDHRTTGAWKAASVEAKAQGILFIPGVELQTNAGHLIALGITGDVGNFLGFEETLDRIHAAGGIAVAPHPFDIRGDGVRGLASKADAVEVFNSLSIDLAGNRVASSMFRGAPIAKVAGSDAHTLEMIGHSVNVVDAEDVDSVLRAIRQGRVGMEKNYIPMDEIINWARERLARSHGEVMAAIEAHYSAQRAWLYRKMLKKFLATGNAPWKALAGMSLAAVRAYGFAKAMSY
jgi:predicted metal-dependent phosphoesterase TrpH